MVDLHIHTNFSDGTNTPEEIILMAKQKNLKAIAISDHDTIDALNQAKYYADIHNLEFINGIEFSALFNETEIHILGYFFDKENIQFLKTLNFLYQTREERNYKIIQKFNQLNLKIDLDYVKSLANSNIITKAHFAKALVLKGYANSIKEAFNIYLAQNRPAYVKRELLSYKDAIKIILDAGGISSLAHPYIYNFSESEIKQNIKILKKEGLNCIECFYSSHTKKQTNNLLNLADELSLKVTAGSDFHGENRKNVALGEIFLGDYVSYEILENLKK